MRTTVRSVATYFPTAIISGRSRDKVSRVIIVLLFAELSVHIFLYQIYCHKSVLLLIFRFLILLN